MAQDAQDLRRWDEFLPSIALGYNASPQRATGYAPYALVYASNPVVPPGSRAVLDQPWDTSWVMRWPELPREEQEEAVRQVTQRARAAAQAGVIAGENLLIA